MDDVQDLDLKLASDQLKQTLDRKFDGLSDVWGRSVVEYDQDIADLVSIQKTVAYHLSVLREGRNRNSPLYRLPVEILGSIVHHSLLPDFPCPEEDARNYYLRLTNLCLLSRYWRDAIEARADLWSYINHSLKLRSVAKILSKPSLLQIKWSSALAYEKGVFEMVCKHKRRWKSFDLLGSDQDIQGLEDSEQAPQLQHLRLAVEYRRSGLEFPKLGCYSVVGNNAPQLRHITLSNVLIPLNAFVLSSLLWLSITTSSLFRVPPTTFDLLDVLASTPLLERLTLCDYWPSISSTSSDIRLENLSQMKFVNVPFGRLVPLLDRLDVPNCQNLTYNNELSGFGEPDLPFESLTSHLRLNNHIRSTIHHMPCKPNSKVALLLAPWFFRLTLGDKKKPSFFCQWHGLPHLEVIVNWLLDKLDCFPLPPSLFLGLSNQPNLWDTATFSTLYRLPYVKQLDISSTFHDSQGHEWLPLMACLESPIIGEGSQSSFWAFPDMTELTFVQPGVHIARLPDMLRGRYGQSTSLGVEEGALPQRLNVLRLPSGSVDDDAIAEIREIVGPDVLQFRP